jgi:hypothetical protein
MNGNNIPKFFIYVLLSKITKSSSYLGAADKIQNDYLLNIRDLFLWKHLVLLRNVNGGHWHMN